MSKKMYFLISSVLVLLLASAGYSQGPIYLDFDRHDIVNTQPGFTSFVVSDSGTVIDGITVYVEGNLDSRWRDALYGVPYELIYRDFIFASSGPVTIRLLGLGAGRECEITIYSFDAFSSGLRSADWTANGMYLFTTSFDNTIPPVAEDSYAFTGTAYADDLGSIVLTCTQGAGSGSPFAFVNALVVIPQGDYVPIKYAHAPQPLDGQQQVPIDVVLGWQQGGTAEKHDVYLGTNSTLVEDANRTNPLGVLVSQDQVPSTYDNYGLFELDTTYYWRIDEVNSAPDYTIFKGQVWSFTTLPYFVMEDFDSYATDDALRDKWKDNSTNGTGAFISLENSIVRGGNSMKYEYRNNTPPYYSQAYADIADLGVDDPDWLGIGAHALVLYFLGDPNNPVDEQMYVRLTDGDNPSQTATVYYNSMVDVAVPQWQKWNIPFTQFPDVNLSNIAQVTIGFGNGSGSDGVVYFEDITLDMEVEESTTAIGDVNLGEVYQQIDGFGGAAVYDVPFLTTHPKKEEIYDLLFKELGLELLRIRNTYGYSTDPCNVELIATAEVVAEAREPNRNPDLRLELVPWSPPAYLKSNGSESGGGTLAKDGLGNFRYDDYAQWWYDSLVEFAAHGVEPDFISIQNEPLIETSYDSCQFLGNQWWNPNVAAYDIAFEAVWQKLNAEMGPNMPQMWAPESMGLMDMGWYISDGFDPMYGGVGNINHVAGFSHHLYFNDFGGSSYDDPDSLIGAMIIAYNDFGYKPLHMTEYVKLDTIPNFDMAVKFAWHIHNCFYYLHSASYFNWTLFRGPYSLGGIVTYTTDDYIIRPQYWFVKAYSHFTGPNWSLLGTSVGGPGGNNLRISAFTSPDNTQLTIVVLNKSTVRTDITMPAYTPASSKVFRSGQTLTWADFGTFAPEMSLPPESITTIWMDKHPTADAGNDQLVLVGDMVTLEGGGSFDFYPGVDNLTYEWTFESIPPASSAVLNDSNTVSSSFTADILGTFVVNLVVNDGTLLSMPDSVTVSVVTPQTMAIEMARQIIGAINAMDKGVFNNPNNKKALANKLNAVISKLKAKNYKGAIMQLRNDLLDKTNGCAKQGNPDKNDWILDCDAQADIYPLIVELIEFLQNI